MNTPAEFSPQINTLLNGVSPLPHLGVIQAQGEDAANFLHNQLSNDVLQAWEPVALGPTHFGPITDPAEHLTRLHVVLDAWADLARRLGAEDFAAAVHAANASAMPADAHRAMSQAMPPDHLWPGLHRYWSKRGA